MERDATGGAGWLSTRRALGALALWLALFALYTANRRAAGAGDTVPAALQAVAFVRGDGPVLDRFDDVLRTPDGRLPGYAQDARGHAVSRYPIGPALVAAPLVAPQVWLLDAIEPGWERDRANVRMRCNRLAKNAAAALVAGTAVVMLGVLRRLGLGAVALPAVATVALGSGDLSVASQAPWQHGPAAFCLAVAIAMVGTVPAGTASRARLAGAGLAAALMVTCRPVDLPFAAALALWAVWHHDRPRRWAFCLPAGLVAVLLAIYHVYFFDTLTGGYAKIEQMHPWAHGVKGSWSTPLLAGIAGTLFSPSHGLFVYSPWTLPALLVLPWSWRAWAGRVRGAASGSYPLPPGGGGLGRGGGTPTDAVNAQARPPSPIGGEGQDGRPGAMPNRGAALTPHPLASRATSPSRGEVGEAAGDPGFAPSTPVAEPAGAAGSTPSPLEGEGRGGGFGATPGAASRSATAWLLAALLPNLVLLSKYSCWWGGHCFGARFWIDAGPLFAIVLALGLDWSRRRARPLFGLFAMAAAAGVAVNAIGWACYPSTWHGKPANADRNHARLWDWRDNEVTRGLREGPRPPQW